MDMVRLMLRGAAVCLYRPCKWPVNKEYGHDTIGTLISLILI